MSAKRTTACPDDARKMMREKRTLSSVEMMPAQGAGAGAEALGSGQRAAAAGGSLTSDVAEGHVVLLGGAAPSGGGRRLEISGSGPGRRLWRCCLGPRRAVAALKEEKVRGLLDDVPALHGLVEQRGRAVALRLDRLVVLVALADDGLPVVEERRTDVLARERLALVVGPRLELGARVAFRGDAVLSHLLREELDFLFHLVAAAHEGRVVPLERGQISIELRREWTALEIKHVQHSNTATHIGKLHAAQVSETLNNVVGDVLLHDEAAVRVRTEWSGKAGRARGRRRQGRT